MKLKYGLFDVLLAFAFGWWFRNSVSDDWIGMVLFIGFYTFMNYALPRVIVPIFEYVHNYLERRRDR